MIFTRACLSKPSALFYREPLSLLRRNKVMLVTVCYRESATDKTLWEHKRLLTVNATTNQYSPNNTTKPSVKCLWFTIPHCLSFAMQRKRKARLLLLWEMTEIEIISVNWHLVPGIIHLLQQRKWKSDDRKNEKKTKKKTLCNVQRLKCTSR